MKKEFISIIGIIILMLIYSFHKKEVLQMKNTSNVTLFVVYDNNEFDKKLKTSWGFACLIEVKGKKILFDTGGDSSILLSNIKALGILPEEIEIIVLSHIHGDHTGGLFGFLEVNPNVTIYLPNSFPQDFKDRIKHYGANYVNIEEGKEIFDGVYSTGELGTWIKEQSLIIKTEKGVVLITGCAHPGIVNIIRKAKELSNSNVYLVIGGFHLIGKSDEEIEGIIKNFKELGVKKVAPCHCTGEKAMNLFEKNYKNNFIKVGVGKIIKI